MSRAVGGRRIRRIDGTEDFNSRGRYEFDGARGESIERKRARQAALLRSEIDMVGTIVDISSGRSGFLRIGFALWG